MVYQFDTFIKKDPDLIITDVQDIRDDDFLPLSELHQLSRADFDSDYIEGALLINIDGKVLSDLKMYDDIDDLWAYLLNMLEEILIHGKNYSSFTFPDQPLKVEIKVVNASIINFSVHNLSANVAAQNFYDIVISKGNAFFMALTTFFDDDDLYDYQLQQLSRLKQVYRSKFYGVS